MELRHLRYFIAAAEEEHFGRAAERLNITRPAVSQLISDLEDELGTLLFERLAHRVKLTAAGRALLPQLQKIMNSLNQAFTTAKRVGEGKSGVLNIGYGSLTLLHPLFRATIRRFHELYPDVTISLVQMPTSEQTEALLSEKIHAGFLHLGPPDNAPNRKTNDDARSRHKSQFNSYLIQSGDLGVALPSDHPLAGRKSVSLEELSDEGFVVVPRSKVCPSYGRIYALCKDAGFEPRIVQEVNTIASQMNLISVGMGVGFAVMGKHFAYPEGISVVALSGVTYPTSFVLGWHSGRTEPVVEKLIDTVKVLSSS